MELVFLPNKLKVSLRKKIQEKIRLNTWVSMALALFGTFLSMIASELYFMEYPTSGKEK